MNEAQNTEYEQWQGKISFECIKYSGIFMLAVLAGFAVSLCNFSVLVALAIVLFTAISFKYFNQVLMFLILYLPFQIALNVAPGIDLASGRVFILYLFVVWIVKSLAEKKFIIKLNLQTLLILLFLFLSIFSITQAWDGERAVRKILVFLSIFPLYFIITSLFPRRNPPSPLLQRGSMFSLFRKRGRKGFQAANIYKILNALIFSGFILSLIGIAQFAPQFFIGVDPIMIFWSEYVAPIFYGNTFGAEVVSNPSWLVNIAGATALRAFSLFPDPHMFSFYLGLLIPIVLAITLVERRRYIDMSPSEFQLVIPTERPRIAVRGGLLGASGGICKRIKRVFYNIFLRSKHSVFTDSSASLARTSRASVGMTKNKKVIKNVNHYPNLGSKLLYIILLTMFLAELLTFSRGGYLGMIAGIGVVIILLWRQISFSKKTILGLISAIAIMFLLTTSQPVASRFLSSFNFSEGSNTERIKNWNQGYEMFADNFLFGVGIGNYSLEINPTIGYRIPVYAHNLYLDIGAEMGIFALVVWIILITVTIYQLYKASKNSNGRFLKAVSIGLIGSLIWFSVHSFFDTPIYSPTILAIFVVIISLAASLISSSE